MKKTPSQLDLFSMRMKAHPEGGKLTIFQSSAGSGKTFTLVKEYLKIILKDPSNFSHVLAVTFTNAATKEMKDRILDVLEELAAGNKSEMRKAIEDDFKSELQDHLPIEKRAAEALTKILYNYSHFDVSTIDHFFTRVVRALAYELKQPVKYDIDVDNERAVENAIERLFGEIHTNKETRNWLKEFALSRLDEDKGWYIEYSLLELGMELFQEKFRENFDDAGKKIDIQQLKKLADGLVFIKESYTRDLKALSKRAVDLISDFDLEIIDLKGGSRSVANGFIKILDGDFKLTDTFIETCNGYQDWFSQSSRKRARIKQLVDGGLDEIGKQLAEHYSKFNTAFITANELLKNIYSYGLMGEMNKNLQKYKLENNLLLLSDIGSMLRQVIGENDAPFIYEKLGSRYKHLLIDEFQDTSNFQWINLKPLVINSLSNGYKVYLAGDVKQSIYRWRGGNLHLILSDVKKQLDQYGKIDETPLNINYRSAKNIVEFNNSFFEIARKILQLHPEVNPDDYLITQAYQHVKQKSFRDDEGYVQVNFLEKPDEYEKHWHEAAKVKVVDTISECLLDGFQYKDILILVDVGRLANELADHLSGANIPVITENSLLVENNQKVKMILSILNWLDNPGDIVSKAAILHHHLEICEGRERIFDHDIYSRENQHEFFNKTIPKELIETAASLKQLPLYELVEELVIIFKLNDPPDAFVQKFQDICLRLASRGIISIESFFNWWNKKITRKDKFNDLGVKVPSETDAVEITTIHQAKGLQRNIVIVPFAGDRFEMRTWKDTIFWTSELPPKFQEYNLLPLRFSDNLIDSEFASAYKKELMEGIVDRLNVAYVAFTRAEDRLYIFTNINKKPENPYGNLHRLIYGVFTDQEFAFQSDFDLENNQFILGSPSKKKIKPHESLIEHITKFPSRHYSEKFTIRKDSQKFFLLFDNTTTKKIREGIVVHAAMELVSSEGDVVRTLDRLEAQGLLRRNEKKNIAGKVSEILLKSEIGKWMETGWIPIKEHEIFSRGEIFKPDLVLVKDNKAILIDYKREKRSAAHEKQILNYADILTAMGLQIEKCLLIYLDEFEIVEVKK